MLPELQFTLKLSALIRKHILILRLLWMGLCGWLYMAHLRWLRAVNFSAHPCALPTARNSSSLCPSLAKRVCMCLTVFFTLQHGEPCENHSSQSFADQIWFFVKKLNFVYYYRMPLDLLLQYSHQRQSVFAAAGALFAFFALF